MYVIATERNVEWGTIIRPKCKAPQLSSQHTTLYTLLSQFLMILVFELRFRVHSNGRLTKNALIRIQGFSQKVKLSNLIIRWWCGRSSV